MIANTTANPGKNAAMQVECADHRDVLQAAATLVAAFASNDRAAYFAAFSEDACFVFHSCATVLADLDAYRQLWASWQAEGFAVLACTSSKPLLTLQGDSAIFVHEVSTRLRIAGAELHSQERETIVFRRQPGSRQWLACHEHLSLLPSGSSPNATPLDPSTQLATQTYNNKALP